MANFLELISPFFCYNQHKQNMMDAYRKYLNKLASNKEDKIFYNSNGEHAKIVIQAIFDNAKHNVCVLSGSFSSIIWSDKKIKKAIEKFLLKGGRIKILVNNKIDTEMLNFLSPLSFAFPHRVIVNYTKQKATSSLTAKKEIHFCVADSKMFRLETDTKKYMAIGNFNNPKLANRLQETFNLFFLKSESILS